MTEIPRFAWFATINKGASSVRHSGESDAGQRRRTNLSRVRLDPSDVATTMRAIILEKSRCMPRKVAGNCLYVVYDISLKPL
jgi:hypothetical protein